MKTVVQVEVSEQEKFFEMSKSRFVIGPSFTSVMSNLEREASSSGNSAYHSLSTTDYHLGRLVLYG